MAQKTTESYTLPGNLIEDTLDINCPKCQNVITELYCHPCGHIPFGSAVVTPATDTRNVKLLLQNAREALDELDGLAIGHESVIEDALVAIRKAMFVIMHKDASKTDEATAWHIVFIAAHAATLCAEGNAEKKCGEWGFKCGYVDLALIAKMITPRTEPAKRVNIIVDNASK